MPSSNTPQEEMLANPCSSALLWRRGAQPFRDHRRYFQNPSLGCACAQNPGVATGRSPGLGSPRAGVGDASILMERNLVGCAVCTCSGTSSAPGSRLCTVARGYRWVSARDPPWDCRALHRRGADGGGGCCAQVPIRQRPEDAPLSQHHSGFFSEIDLDS